MAMAIYVNHVEVFRKGPGETNANLVDNPLMYQEL